MWASYWNPHDRKGEQTPASCPMTFIHASWNDCVHTHHIHTHACWNVCMRAHIHVEYQFISKESILWTAFIFMSLSYSLCSLGGWVLCSRQTCRCRLGEKLLFSPCRWLLAGFSSLQGWGLSWSVAVHLRPPEALWHVCFCTGQLTEGCCIC